MRRVIRWATVLAVAMASATAPRLAADVRADEGSEERLPPLEVTLDKSKVDLEAHRLEVRMSRTASHVTIKVFGDSGALLAEETHSFAGRPAGTPLVVTWHPSSDEAVARIDVFGHDEKGYYAGVRIVPWSLEIPHEEVQFETNRATIRPSEEPKLTRTLDKIKDAVAKHRELNPTLYVAGHTDTRGSAEHNLELSRRRARAIAAWFSKRGIGIPIAYEGFGETALLVQTEDEVDEPKNRRVDYVLSAEAPRLASGLSPRWKRIGR